VPQQRQLLMERLVDGHHPTYPPLAQLGLLFPECAVVLLACGLGCPLARRSRGIERRHRRRASTRVGVGSDANAWATWAGQSWSTAASTARPEVPNPARRNMRAVACHWLDWVGIVYGRRTASPVLRCVHRMPPRLSANLKTT
jgi:hypothetical protein